MTSPRPTMIEADHPQLGRLFAAVDPSVRFVTGRVEGSRFAALLAPFQTAEAARAALAEAGASTPGVSS
jgi:hypothetical protein